MGRERRDVFWRRDEGRDLARSTVTWSKRVAWRVQGGRFEKKAVSKNKKKEEEKRREVVQKRDKNVLTHPSSHILQGRQYSNNRSQGAQEPFPEKKGGGGLSRSTIRREADSSAPRHKLWRH